jgi:predicted RNA-binding protein with PIN domain
MELPAGSGGRSGATGERGEAVRWLVDGNNVVGARPDGWWRDRPGAQARLVAQLDAWQRRVGYDVCVVFDGRDRPELSGRSRAGLEVRFAGSSARDAADDVIAGLAAAAGEAGRWRVVTSDAGLRRRLPPGLDVVGAGSFRHHLDGTQGAGAGGGPPTGR